MGTVLSGTGLILSTNEQDLSPVEPSPESKIMPTKEEIIDQIKQVFDPEIPVNIWDLGLIYTIDVTDWGIEITMSLTSQACPSAQQLPDMVRDSVSKLPEAKNIKVQVVWQPAWNPSMISAEGKKVLRIEE